MPNRLGRVGVVVAVSIVVTVASASVAEAKQNKAKALAAGALAAAKLSSAVEADTTQYVGTVDGTGAYIAIVERGRQVDVYVCDGTDIIAWPQGTVTKNGEFTAKSAKGVTVTGTITDSAASGTVTLPDGSEHDFSAARAVVPAGLYVRLADGDASNSDKLAATIVLADGTQRGGFLRQVDVCLKIFQSIKEYTKQLNQESGTAFFDETLANLRGQYANYASHHCPVDALSGANLTS